VRRQQLGVKPPLASEVYDMNGSGIGNGHPIVNGGQTNDHLMGSANGHFVANGVDVGSQNAPTVDDANPVFSSIVSGHDELSIGHSRNAEVYTQSCCTHFLIKQ